jgi:peptide/nickel transport system substrate-binding protein
MKQDFEKAKALLKEAGYDGTPIIYLHPMDAKVQRDVGTVMVNAMRKAGFTVEDVQMDTATMFTRRTNKNPPKQGGWNVFITGFAGDALMDPLSNPYVTGACEKGPFVGWPCDKPLQELWQTFLLASDDCRAQGDRGRDAGALERDRPPIFRSGSSTTSRPGAKACRASSRGRP